ncbi:hypothetical protein [Streptacidiphilus melanogenes]|uniref:hypothetical protein n=1 Tax=Streptacidiphilus melanogenes TaxID=411235 RepID=UPI0005AB1A89|nr:hypothetical protein [Streptacidiphilus melanogenes]
MGLFSRSSRSSSAPASEVRRPILDPDSEACVWLNAADASDPATVDRALAAARVELDAMAARRAEISDWLDRS